MEKEVLMYNWNHLYDLKNKFHKNGNFTDSEMRIISRFLTLITSEAHTMEELTEMWNYLNQ